MDNFRVAMVDGVRPHGAHLFPSMPYENFRHMSESDIRALAFRVVEQFDVLKDIASSVFAGADQLDFMAVAPAVHRVFQTMLAQERGPFEVPLVRTTKDAGQT
ncbi:hypothetical protein [Celeribacter naphthalenivorans]|uniref:hypothetical protein n=1 Tax=Celeribacter naphthalenivorans TaxID=1614694 RepID=UPI00384A5D6F